MGNKHNRKYKIDEHEFKQHLFQLKSGYSWWYGLLLYNLLYFFNCN